jgi:hypothetical protein
MKHARSILSLIMMVGLLLSTIACGSSEPVIETSTAEMNLRAADIGPGWTMSAEQDAEETPELDLPHVQDGNMRMFEAEETIGMVIGYVISTKTVAAAEKEMASGEATSSFEESLQAQVPEISLEMLQSPDVGDEAVMVGGSHPDLGLNIYMLTFRKANVIVMLAAIAPEEFASEEAMVNYAGKVEARIQ